MYRAATGGTCGGCRPLALTLLEGKPNAEVVLILPARSVNWSMLPRSDQLAGKISGAAIPTSGCPDAAQKLVPGTPSHSPAIAAFAGCPADFSGSRQ